MVDKFITTYVRLRQDSSYQKLLKLVHFSVIQKTEGTIFRTQHTMCIDAVYCFVYATAMSGKRFHLRNLSES